uniref:Uncharacterized protein n=1 Tax=Fagus sylvatica TaxID=28930 RepID=A0A2N9G2Y3_FAGSY
MNMDANKRPTQNGVIISVYVESPKMRSPKKTVALKKTHKPISSVSKTTRKCVSDRRAHLLAYARELRNAGSQEIHRPRNNLRTKPKKWKWLTTPASLCIPSHRVLERTSSRWRYERIPTEEYTENVDLLCGSKIIGGIKRKATKRSNSHFIVKF